MIAILRSARAQGAITDEVDVELLAEQLCEVMRHVGLGVLYRDANAPEAAVVLCHLVFEGGTVQPPRDGRLDRSPARRAANAAIRAWAGRDRLDRSGRPSLLPSVAPAECARRG